MISVCIPTYNGEKYIWQQIDSIIRQLSDDDEIIISDDGSTDKTISIIKSFCDSRIKIFIHEKSIKNKSDFRFDLTTRNIENAIKQAKGDYIIMADQDDVWLTNRVSEVLPLLETYTMVINDCKIVDKDADNILKESYFSLVSSKKGMLKNFMANSYLGCCMAFRKESLEYIMPFPNRPVPHDIWIGLMSEIFGKVYFLNKPLILYRRHGENLSNSAESSDNSFSFKIKYRFLLLYSVCLRILSSTRKSNNL